MKYLSLFSGIGVAEYAIHRVFKDAECLGFSEIDKRAIKVYRDHYPDHPYLGDVSKIETESLPDFDLLVFGSPCTDLSIAKNNRQSLEGSQSKLFFKAVEIIKVKKPKYFLMENVYSMSQDARDEISKILGVQPIHINSKLVSAQSRDRYYWCNFPTSQPHDRGIKLKDILLNEVDDRYTLSIKAVEYMKREVKGRSNWDKGQHNESIKDKSRTLTANMHKGTPYNVLVDLRFMVTGEFVPENSPNYIGGIFTKRLWVKDGKFLSRNFPQAKRVYSSLGKSACLNANGGGLGARGGLYFIPLDHGKPNMEKCIKLHNIYNVTQEGVVGHIRRLTPIECERLQTLPDDYTKSIADTYRYKALGNSMTQEVITHLLTDLRKHMGMEGYFHETDNRGVEISSIEGKIYHDGRRIGEFKNKHNVLLTVNGKGQYLELPFRLIECFADETLIYLRNGKDTFMANASMMKKAIAKVSGGYSENTKTAFLYKSCLHVVRNAK